MLLTGRFGFSLFLMTAAAAHAAQAGANYKVLAPLTHGNLSVFPVVADLQYDTKDLMTLDEGLRSGRVVITESGGEVGLVRPQIWPEVPPIRVRSSAMVNQLVLINNSGRPLLLLAGEIVTGGKQDRVVGSDRIVGAHSAPVPLGVFCVEPHRWVETSATFGAMNSSMAQPSVRAKAVSNQDQAAVWSEVARSRLAVAQAAPMASGAIERSSSYAAAMQNGYVRKELDGVAAPIEESYALLMKSLRAQRAVGAVVAIDGELLWVDVFASSELLEKYWPKLIRSYAAEAIGSRGRKVRVFPVSVSRAQQFLDDLQARREVVESEPGLYRNTHLIGANFDAFVLTSLLPGMTFPVHLAKMRR